MVLCPVRPPESPLEVVARMGMVPSLFDQEETCLHEVARRYTLSKLCLDAITAFFAGRYYLHHYLKAPLKNGCLFLILGAARTLCNHPTVPIRWSFGLFDIFQPRGVGCGQAQQKAMAPAALEAPRDLADQRGLADGDNYRTRAR